MVASAERSGSSPSDCTDCSHCENRSSSRLRSGAGVRISVNLEQFFSDQRARAFMWAPYGRCVQWLSRRVARVFSLPDDIALMSRGHVLPVFEPLLMLDRDDPIEVVYTSHMFTPYNNQDNSNATSPITTSKLNPTTCVVRNVHPVQSEATNRQVNFEQDFTSNQCSILSESHDISSVQKFETTTESLDGQNTNNIENLQQLKRRALRLLDEHCHMLDEVSAPKRLRRRRRRRRPPAAACDHDESAVDGTSAPQGSGQVLRNGTGSRPPRLVHPLSPSTNVLNAIEGS